jgi:hypothetical protein
MVASAVLGAAAGTGMALFVAMTIVIYRYYSHRRKVKEWDSLDRMPFPNTPTKIINKPIYAVAQTVSSKFNGVSIFIKIKVRIDNFQHKKNIRPENLCFLIKKL